MDFLHNSNNGCLEYIESTAKKPYQVLSLLVPIDDRVWTHRSGTWLAFFKAMVAILAILYLAVGLVSAILLVKKKSLRLKTRTFFAVYLSMAILGFSRAALLILDPYGILGYISDTFPAWIIISRFLASAGFPSVVAASTLIILTLFKLVNTKQGAQWYENRCYVLTLLTIPYAIALLAEALGHINTYPAIFFGLICETVFVFWGLFICIAYLIAGTRLLNALKKCYRNATRTSETGSRAIDVELHDRKTKKIARKILIITFGTAATGIMYSIVSAGAVITVLLLLFLDCMGLNNRTNSDAWLVVQFVNYITEIIFACLILYSITDVSHLVSFIKFLITCQPCGSCGSVGAKESESSSPDTPDTCISPNGPGLEEDLGTTIRNYPFKKAGHLQNQFVLTTNKSSGSSIESGDDQSTPRKSMVTSHSHDDIVKSPGSHKREKRRSQPLDLDTISRVLSIGDDTPPPTWLTRPKLKRNRGSDPTLIKSEGSSSLPLRHCQSHTPYSRTEQPHHTSPLVTPLLEPQPYPQSCPLHSQSHPLYPQTHPFHPQSHQRAT